MTDNVSRADVVAALRLTCGCEETAGCAVCDHYAAAIRTLPAAPAAEACFDDGTTCETHAAPACPTCGGDRGAPDFIPGGIKDEITCTDKFHAKGRCPKCGSPLPYEYVESTAVGYGPCPDCAPAPGVAVGEVADVDVPRHRRSVGYENTRQAWEALCFDRDTMPLATMKEAIRMARMSLEAALNEMEKASPAPTVEVDEWVLDVRVGMAAVYRGPRRNCLSGISCDQDCVFVARGAWINGAWVIDDDDRARALRCYAALRGRGEEVVVIERGHVMAHADVIVYDERDGHYGLQFAKAAGKRLKPLDGQRVQVIVRKIGDGEVGS